MSAEAADRSIPAPKSSAETVIRSQDLGRERERELAFGVKGEVQG